MSRSRARAVLVVLAVAVATLLLAAPSRADGSTALLYDYKFVDTSGTVANAAPAGPAVPVKMIGDWSSVSDGVRFAGNTSGSESIGYAKPATGYSLNVPAGTALGFGVRFRYSAPSTGVCFGDTPNITQVGRFATKEAQAKIQLSKCADNDDAVNIECRFAGSSTPSAVLPVRNTKPLVDGDTYVATCRKTPDGAGGASVVLSVTQLYPATGDATVTDTFAIANLGLMRTREALSVGNKYPMPRAWNNTDQFVGDVNRSVYCVGRSNDVAACLTNNLPTG